MRTALKPKEKLILESKRHWFVLVKPVIALLFFVAVTVLVFNISSAAGKVVLVINIIPLATLVWKILERRGDIWVVTTLRVIDEYGVMSRNAKESPLDKINDISFRQSLIGKIFRYGSVQIQTAAEIGTTTYHFVSSPKRLKDAVTKAREDYRQSQIAEQAEKLAHAIKEGTEPARDTKECPYCAEIIKANARLCRFCGRELGWTIQGRR